MVNVLRIQTSLDVETTTDPIAIGELCSTTLNNNLATHIIRLNCHGDNFEWGEWSERVRQVVFEKLPDGWRLEGSITWEYCEFWCTKQDT